MLPLWSAATSKSTTCGDRTDLQIYKEFGGALANVPLVSTVCRPLLSAAL